MRITTAEMTFLEVEWKVCLRHGGENALETSHMLGKGGCVDSNIVKVANTHVSFQSWKKGVHYSLIFYRSFARTERYHYIFIEAIRCDESRLFTSLLIKGNLPVSAAQVDG